MEIALTIIVGFTGILVLGVVINGFMEICNGDRL